MGTEPYHYMNALMDKFSSAEKLSRCELQLDATTELEEEQFKDKRLVLFAEHHPRLKFLHAFQFFRLVVFDKQRHGGPISFDTLIK